MNWICVFMVTTVTRVQFQHGFNFLAAPHISGLIVRKSGAR